MSDRTPSSSPVPRNAILVVEGEEPTRRRTGDYLDAAGHAVLRVANGSAAMGLIKRYRDELGVVLLDLEAQGVNGLDVLRHIRADASLDHLPIMVVTVDGDRDARRRAAAVGADEFLVQPIDQVELVARVRHLLHLRDLARRAVSMQGMLDTLASVIERRDRYTGDHAHRVAAFAVRAAEELGVPAGERLPMLEGAVIRDVGMVSVPDAIVLSPRALTAEERVVVEHHVLEGVAICGRLAPDSILLKVVRHHHEAWDGTGYPDHLRGEGIPLCARIVAACDAFDALVSPRPYRTAMSWAEAHRVLQEGAGSQWDPDVVQALQRVLAIDASLVEAAHVGGAQLGEMLGLWRDRLVRQVDRDAR